MTINPRLRVVVGRCTQESPRPGLEHAHDGGRAYAEGFGGELFKMCLDCGTTWTEEAPPTPPPPWPMQTLPEYERWMAGAGADPRSNTHVDRRRPAARCSLPAGAIGLEIEGFSKPTQGRRRHSALPHCVDRQVARLNVVEPPLQHVEEPLADLGCAQHRYLRDR